MWRRENQLGESDLSFYHMGVQCVEATLGLSGCESCPHWLGHLAYLTSPDACCFQASGAWMKGRGLWRHSKQPHWHCRVCEDFTTWRSHGRILQQWMSGSRWFDRKLQKSTHLQAQCVFLLSRQPSHLQNKLNWATGCGLYRWEFFQFFILHFFMWRNTHVGRHLWHWQPDTFFFLCVFQTWGKITFILYIKAFGYRAANMTIMHKKVTKKF